MYSYLLRILENSTSVSYNTISVKVEREKVAKVSQKLFSLGGRRMGGNSAVQNFVLSGITVKVIII